MTRCHGHRCVVHEMSLQGGGGKNSVKHKGDGEKTKESEADGDRTPVRPERVITRPAVNT